MQEKLQQKPTRPIPVKPYRVIAGISDHIYAQLPVPKSVEEAQRMIATFKLEIGNIQSQVGTNKVDSSTMSWEQSQNYQVWRRKALTACRVREQWIGLVKMWITDNPDAIEMQPTSVNGDRSSQNVMQRLSGLERENKFLRQTIAELAGYFSKIMDKNLSSLRKTNTAKELAAIKEIEAVMLGESRTESKN